MEVTLPDSSTNEFTYDGDKRRVARKDASGDEKWFLHDGVNILQDLATDGTVWTSYVQGIGIDKLISVSEWAGQTAPQKRYYHSDAIGSVRSLTDEDEDEVGTYEYDAWGKVTSETGSSENEYKFTSRRWEEEIGLQYNRARFYDPETGRFITPDPLTGGPDDPTISYFSGVYSQFHRFIRLYLGALQPDKHNRYIYCYNNPINRIDPLGLESNELDDTEVAPPEPVPVPEPPTPTPPPASEASPMEDTSSPGETSITVLIYEGVDTEQNSGEFQDEDYEAITEEEIAGVLMARDEAEREEHEREKYEFWIDQNNIRKREDDNYWQKYHDTYYYGPGGIAAAADEYWQNQWETNIDETCLDPAYNFDDYPGIDGY